MGWPNTVIASESPTKIMSIPASSTYMANVTQVDTTGWNQDTLIIKANVTYDSTTEERHESLVFDQPTAYITTEDYICNSRSETFNVTVYHPFNDNVTYNITPTVPAGWSITPTSAERSAATPGNISLEFTIASDGTDSNFTINVTANYTYPYN